MSTTGLNHLRCSLVSNLKELHLPVATQNDEVCDRLGQTLATASAQTQKVKTFTTNEKDRVDVSRWM